MWSSSIFVFLCSTVIENQLPSGVIYQVLIHCVSHMMICSSMLVVVFNFSLVLSYLIVKQYWFKLFNSLSSFEIFDHIEFSYPWWMFHFWFVLFPSASTLFYWHSLRLISFLNLYLGTFAKSNQKHVLYQVLNYHVIVLIKHHGSVMLTCFYWLWKLKKRFFWSQAWKFHGLYCWNWIVCSLSLPFWVGHLILACVSSSFPHGISKFEKSKTW